MKSALSVSYNGQLVGRLAEADVQGRTCVFFEYDPAFVATGIELSPFHLPLGLGLKSRDGSRPTEQLPGLFEDSLPDSWGMSLMLDWFRRNGKQPHEVTPLMQLGYIGDRGMGALSYRPESSPDLTAQLDLERIYADALLAEAKSGYSNALTAVGTSAGGVQPKALIGTAADPSKPRYWTGAQALPDGYDAWIVKFTVERPDHPGGDGRVEYAFSLMARAAGIDLPPTQLLKAGGKAHFAVKRFDREGTRRIHHHTLSRLLHAVGSDLDYETLLRVTQKITRDHREVLRAYRRAVFNVLACNEDDHGKNHGFVFDNGEWRLGPAYDVTYRRLLERGLAVCGERRNASLTELSQLASRAAIQKTAATAIVEDVCAGIRRWSEFANAADVPARVASEIQRDLDRQLSGVAPNPSLGSIGR